LGRSSATLSWLLSSRDWTLPELTLHTGTTLGKHLADILVPLSRHVGPDGYVVGVDADPRHLAAARALAVDERLVNVEILKRNVCDTGLPRDGFDLVHVTLASTAPDRSEELLAEAIALARPGGVVAIQCSAWLARDRARSIEVWGHKNST
jgi:SAM-dependent methyltransferase